MKRWKQILILCGIAAAFVLFDLSVYHLFTARYVNHNSAEFTARSVEVSAYLPFAEETGIVKTEGSEKLTGTLPVIDGAAALFPMFSAFVCAKYPESAVCYEDGDFTAESALQYRNTRGAFQALADGDADLIFCAKPSAAQVEYARSKGVEFESVPVAREAFVFLVNADNPVDGLTSEEVRGIYTGKIRNWAEVGGPSCPIDALTRNEGSGSETTMRAFLGGEPAVRTVSGYFGAPIGYSFRFYVEGVAKAGGVKLLSLDGVYPDEASIRSGAYPVIGNVYALYRKGEENPNVQSFIDWVLSEEGQDVVEKSGYVRVQ